MCVLLRCCVIAVCAGVPLCRRVVALLCTCVGVVVWLCRCAVMWLCSAVVQM